MLHLNGSRMQVLKTQTPMLSLMYRFASQDGQSSLLYIITRNAPGLPTEHPLGVVSLWTGLSASILRQGTYSTARFGLHTILSQQWLRYTGETKLSLGSNVACAAVAGGVAGLVGNPTEVVLVRMCADGARPQAQRFAYTNALKGLSRTIREEGLDAFSRGISANVARSVLMSMFILHPWRGTVTDRFKMSRKSLRKVLRHDCMKRH